MFFPCQYRPSPQHAIANGSYTMRPLGSDSYYPDDYNRTNQTWMEDSPLRTSSSTYLVPNSPAMSPMRKDNYSSRTLGPVNGLHGYPGGGGSTGGSPYRQRATLTKTLPRFLHSTPVAGGGGGSVGPASFAQSQSSSLYLSQWNGALSDDFANPLREYGYPSDYGLPVPGAGAASSGGIDMSHVTVNPLTDLLFSEESDIVAASGRRSTTMSPMRAANVGHVLADMSTNSGLRSDLLQLASF